jgi:dethiobiotin synthetase
VSIFIIATGTDVGKTMTSTAFMVKYGQECNLFYWKPVQTGPLETTDTYFLEKALGNSRRILPAAYSYSHPSSPHYSASLENSQISIEYLNLLWERNQPLVGNHPILIEAAGGVMVPLNQDTIFLDWIQEMKIPVLLVVSTLLGTINHSLLTLDALHLRKIPVLGFLGYGENVDTWQSSEEAIMKWGRTLSFGRFFLEKNLQTSELQKEIHKNFDPSLKLKGIFH